MKITATILAVILLLSMCSCAAPAPIGGIAATTLPVYQFTQILCQGTDIPVVRLVTENVSCLHDYSLTVRQAKALESAELIIMNGADLEVFLEDVLAEKNVIDASAGIELIEGCHEEGHEGHHHEADPHIWLSPKNAMVMAENICAALEMRYPSHAATFRANLQGLLTQLQSLQDYGQKTLAELSCRKLITFHDGFAYFAQCFSLDIVKAIEEESGSEASAQELIELIGLVNDHGLPAIFVEENGSVSAAQAIAQETGAKVFSLRMAMAGNDYFAAMYHNIDTIKEAMG